MSLMNKIFSNRKLSKNKPTPLARYFLDLLGRPDFPLTLAKDSFKELDKSAKNEQELFEFVLEDIINISIYATFYEEIFRALHDHPHLATNLVQKFAEDEKEREVMIAGQSQNHFNFILNGGMCNGCNSCDHHGDIADLLEHWNKGDIDYLLNLYIGMQTIQFAMEHILFDIIPVTQEVCLLVSHDNIQDFRKYVFEYSEDRI